MTKALDAAYEAAWDHVAFKTAAEIDDADINAIARSAIRAALPAEPTHEAMATLVQTLEATASRECPGAVAEILYGALRAHLLGGEP